MPKKYLFVVVTIIVCGLSIKWVVDLRIRNITQIAYYHLNNGDSALEDGDYDIAIAEYKESLRYYPSRERALTGLERAMKAKYSVANAATTEKEITDDDIIDQITSLVAAGRNDEAYELLSKIENRLLRDHIKKIYWNGK